jgi:tetratricopeptide (TPR) repeat protein
MSSEKDTLSTEINETVEQVNEPVKEKASQSIDSSLDGLQLFFEKNKKMITYVGGGLLVVVAAVLFYKFYYLPEKETEATNELFWSQNYFEKDSFDIALKGGKQVNTANGPKAMLSLEQIADDYSMTKSGNLANYMAGICYLRTGKFDKAIEFLGKYDGDDQMLSSIAVGAIGDANMELNKVDDAINFYLKAADKKSNIFTSPIYLKKAAFAYETKGKYAEALALYERIQKEYGTTDEGKEIEKEIAKVKSLGNL